MLSHPFIRPSGPALGGGGAPMHAAPVRPTPMPMHQPNPMGQQRTEVALGLAKQRALAQALRGGSASGVPAAPANPGIMRPQGIPQVR